MSCDIFLFDKDLACVRLFASVAWLSGAARAFYLFLPSTMGMVLADPPYAKTNGTAFINQDQTLLRARPRPAWHLDRGRAGPCLQSQPSKQSGFTCVVPTGTNQLFRS